MVAAAAVFVLMTTIHELTDCQTSPKRTYPVGMHPWNEVHCARFPGLPTRIERAEVLSSPLCPEKPLQGSRPALQNHVIVSFKAE